MIWWCDPETGNTDSQNSIRFGKGTPGTIFRVIPAIGWVFRSLPISRYCRFFGDSGVHFVFGSGNVGTLKRNKK